MTQATERLNQSERSQDRAFIRKELIKWRDQTDLKKESNYTCGDIIKDSRTQEIYLIVKVTSLLD